MRVSKVCQRWGEQTLDVEAFRAAENDESVRARMACALLRNQDDYVGVHRREIFETFGDQTGYSGYTEGSPAYEIESGRTRDQGSWQIVFRINKFGEVKEIVVHKPFF